MSTSIFASYRAFARNLIVFGLGLLQQGGYILAAEICKKLLTM